MVLGADPLWDLVHTPYFTSQTKALYTSHQNSHKKMKLSVVCGCE